MQNYPIVIHKDKDSCYGVTVPDMPGCFSAGDTFEEALVMAREAILFHAESILSDGGEIPQPHPVEEHLGNPDFADGIWAVVSVDLENLLGKAVRINITMNERVLAVVDEYVSKVGETRSGLLQRAVNQFMKEHKTSFRQKPARIKAKAHISKR